MTSNRRSEPDAGFIPPVFFEELLRELPVRLAEQEKWLDECLATLPRPPWHRRKWNLLKWRVERAREWLALQIAPWLERDPW